MPASPSASYSRPVASCAVRVPSAWKVCALLVTFLTVTLTLQKVPCALVFRNWLPTWEIPHFTLLMVNSKSPPRTLSPTPKVFGLAGAGAAVVFGGSGLAGVGADVLGVTAAGAE